MNILGQKTMPWGNILLGNSNYYIWAKGCTITVLAEILGVTPDVVNQKLNDLPVDKNGNTGFALDKNGQRSLVIWGRIKEAFPEVSVERFWSYNNDDVLAKLGAGDSVMVEVDAAPIGNAGGSHFVRYVGNHKLHDPWTGTEKPTSDFPTLKGYAVVSRTTKPQTEAPAPAPAAPTPPPAAPVAPVAPAVPAAEKTYKGLDLTNLASVKAAIDTWFDVSHGAYIKTDDHTAYVRGVCDALGIAQNTDVSQVVASINALKDGFAKEIREAMAATPAQDNKPAIEPALKNVPPHEKEAVMSHVHALVDELKSLLGI